MLASVRMATIFVKSATTVSDLPAGSRPHVAFVGRSNVGKSSLLNALTGQKGLARVSATPGRTQMINVFDADGAYFLIDLPGYGYAKASKEKREVFASIIQEYLWNAPSLKLVLQIIDARHGLTDLDQEMLTFLRHAKIPVVIVANKVDKLSRSEALAMRRELEKTYSDAKIIFHSNVTGDGRGEILRIFCLLSSFAFLCMEVLVDVFELLVGDVGVDLRCCN